MVVRQTDDDGKFAFLGPPPGATSSTYMTPTAQRSDWIEAARGRGRADQPLDLGDVVNDAGERRRST